MFFKAEVAIRVLVRCRGIEEVDKRQVHRRLGVDKNRKEVFMSDEEVSPAEEEQTEKIQEGDDSAPVKTKTKESLRERFRLTADEEILHDIKPCILC